METRNIAIDTQFIISQNYLHGNLIKEFVNQSKKGIVNIFITDIVVREVMAHFKAGLIEVKSKNLKSKGEKLYILRHFPHFENYFNLPEIDIDECYSIFELFFQTWVKDNNVKIISTDDLKVGGVLNDYFKRVAPFEDSKKSEFPDAFTLAALRDFFNKRGEKAYFVTNDAGVRKYKDHTLITGIDASALLQMILQEGQNTEAINFIIQQFIENEKFILDKSNFYLYGAIKTDILASYMIDDRLITGISSLEVHAIDITAFEVIGIGDNDFTVLCSIEFDFEAEIDVRSSALSTPLGGVYSKGEDEPDSIVIKEELKNDMAIRGIYDLAGKSLAFKNYSIAPMDVIPKSRKSR